MNACLQKFRYVLLIVTTVLTIFWVLNPRMDHPNADETRSLTTKAPEYKIHIVTLADKAAKKAYRLQLETIKCYVEANGYNLIIPSNDLMKDEECRTLGKKDIMQGFQFYSPRLWVYSRCQGDSIVKNTKGKKTQAKLPQKLC